MSMDDEVEVACPYCDDGTQITAHVDTIGDPSVGMGPDGIFKLDGACVHVEAINEDIEERGSENIITEKWPTFMELIDNHYDKQARVQAEADEQWERSNER